MNPEPDPVLTIDDVADATGRHYRTVRSWLVADPQRLRGVKRGNRWYIRRSALKEFLDGDEHGATA